MSVPITFFNTTFQRIPLYLVVLGFLFLGIFLSWITSIINTIAVSLKLSSKNAAIKNSYHTIEELKKENQRLEVEVARLKGEEAVSKPSLSERINHRLS